MDMIATPVPHPVPAAAAAEKRGRLDSLQAFRGVAALLVVLHHAGAFALGHLGGSFLGNTMDWGASGVDFFFVLSGFIIFFVHRRDLGRPDRLRPFAAKRLVRIYPIYWVACAVVIPLYFFSSASGPVYARDPLAILTSVLLIPQGHYPILAQAWTLTFELLFYVIFALLIWRPRVFLAPVAAWMSACVGLYLFALAQKFAGAGDGREPFGFPWDWLFSRHNVLFGFGVGAAALVMRGTAVRWYRALVWTGVALFLGFAACNQPGSPFDPVKALDYPLTFGMASVLVVIGASGLDLTVPTLRVPSFGLYLGNASYSIYLFHSVAMSLAVRPAARLVERHWLGVNTASLLMCAVAVAAGCLMHSFVERPLLDVLRRRFVTHPA